MKSRMKAECKVFLEAVVEEDGPLPEKRCQSVLKWGFYNYYPCLLPEGHTGLHECKPSWLKMEWKEEEAMTEDEKRKGA